jgi:carboxymethylenebutenolidase
MTLPQPAEVDDFTHAGFLRAPTSPMQGIVMSHITLTAADGHTLGAWRTGPDTARRGLVVVQEIFGVNGHMRRVCEQFAGLGFAVVAPALFDRAERDVELDYSQEDVQRGMALRAQIAPEATMADVTAAAAALGDRKLGIIGYCWGGTVAWWGATRTSLFHAADCWYGGSIAAARTEQPHCPVQMHFGEVDGSIPMTDVEAIRAAHPEAEIYTYPGAGHGFGCEDRGSFSAPDAELAQQRTVEFFNRHLGT